MQSILLLEDHADTARWLQTIAIGSFPEAEVLRVACLTDARRALRKSHFQLALLDIHLPDGSGLDLIPLIKAFHADTLIVMTTVFDDDQHLFDALRAGAQGYLLKEQSGAELMAKLQGIPLGEPPLSPGIARRMLTYFHSDRGSATHNIACTGYKEPSLSPREEEALTLLAKGYSIKELARLLAISDHTAAGYAKNIYRKLNISTRAEATLEASRLGLVHH